MARVWHALFSLALHFVSAKMSKVTQVHFHDKLCRDKSAESAAGQTSSNHETRHQKKKTTRNIYISSADIKSFFFFRIAWPRPIDIFCTRPKYDLEHVSVAVFNCRPLSRGVMHTQFVFCFFAGARPLVVVVVEASWESRSCMRLGREEQVRCSGEHSRPPPSSCQSLRDWVRRLRLQLWNKLTMSIRTLGTGPPFRSQAFQWTDDRRSVVWNVGTERDKLCGIRIRHGRLLCIYWLY